VKLVAQTTRYHVYDRLYPIHSGIDRVLDTIEGLLEGVTGLVGRAGADFDRISARSFPYPQATGLSRHEDAMRFTGGNVFYGEASQHGGPS
jgi:hypothetical protein